MTNRQPFIDIAEIASELDLPLPKTPIPADAAMMRLEMVATAALCIDTSYQRRISLSGLARIKRICRGFSWARFGALSVTEASGGMVVVDGQHRAIAAVVLGIERVPAVIAPPETTASQAMDFVGINTIRTTVASIDSFRARVTAGDPTACAVADMLQHLQIDTDVAAGTSLRPNQTRAVKLLERMVNQVGEGLTFTALEMLRDAQPEQPNLLTAFAIEVTVRALVRLTEQGNNIDRLAEVLEETDFETLRTDAAQMVRMTGGRHAQRGAELLLRACAKRKRIAS